LVAAVKKKIVSRWFFIVIEKINNKSRTLRFSSRIIFKKKIIKSRGCWQSTCNGQTKKRLNTSNMHTRAILVKCLHYIQIPVDGIQGGVRTIAGKGHWPLFVDGYADVFAKIATVPSGVFLLVHVELFFVLF
jgi:hypothetical protein